MLTNRLKFQILAHTLKNTQELVGFSHLTYETLFFQAIPSVLSQWRCYQKTVPLTCLKLLSSDGRILCLKMCQTHRKPCPVIQMLDKAKFTIKVCGSSSTLWLLLQKKQSELSV